MIDKFTGKNFFLSNFYLHNVMFKLADGTIGVFPSAEHAFQACKTRSVKDQKRIMDAQTPGRAKRIGRSVALRSDWERVKVNVMSAILSEKFRDETLAGLLLETGGQELIEGNVWHDNFWGICTCDKCGNDGENMLGRILMVIRDTLEYITQDERLSVRLIQVCGISGDPGCLGWPDYHDEDCVYIKVPYIYCKVCTKSDVYGQTGIVDHHQWCDCARRGNVRCQQEL